MMKYFTVLLFLTFTTLISGQVTFEITQTNADAGSQVNIEFKVSNFSNLISYQIPISWNKEIIRLSGIQNVANLPGLTATDDNFGIQEGINTGSMASIWESPGFTARNLPNGTVLFTLRFDVIGSPGQTTPVYIDDDWVTVVEFVDASFNTVPWLQTQGRVDVTGEAAPGRIFASNETGQPNGTVCVRIQGDGIVDIGVMQFTLAWDPAFMSFESVPSASINIPGFNENNYEVQAAQGRLLVTWQSPAGLNRPNGSTLFEVCFRINALSGSSPVSFTNDPLEIEFATSAGMPLAFGSTPGTVSVEGEPDCIPEGLTFIFDNIKADVDENVCIPFRVANFTNIASIQLSIQWDPTVLEFLAVNEPMLTGFNPDIDINSNNALSGGYIIMVWSSGEGQTISDFSALFNVCFKVIGDFGQSSPIQVTNIGLSSGIEVTNEDGMVIPPFFCDGSVLVDPGAEITVVVENTIRPTCPNDSTGAIQIDVIGGTTPYVFTWRNQGGQVVGNGQNLTGVGSGTYTVTVRDANNIEVTSAPVILTSMFTINIAENIVRPTCRNDQDGSITLTVTGNTGTISNYAWSNNTSGSSANAISGLAAGMYSVTISFGNGCTTSRNFTVPQGLGPVIEAFVDAGAGIINLTVTGGTQPYQFDWSDNATTQNRTGLEPGMYLVTVTDAAGCSATGGPYIIGDEDLTLDITQLDYNGFGVSCNGICDGRLTAIPLGGFGPYTYVWSNGSTTDVINNLCAGSYTVTVTDSEGTSATRTISLTAPNRLRIEISEFMRSTMDNGSATVTSTGGAVPVSFVWNTTPPTNGASVNSQPAHVLVVTATDANGCTATRSIDFSRDLADECFDHRKVITPNGDGRNDELVITCINGTENQLDIFDRYGKMVQSFRNYDNTWGGTGMDGSILPDGGYFFVLRVTAASGVEETVKGSFNILRDAR